MSARLSEQRWFQVGVMAVTALVLLSGVQSVMGENEADQWGQQRPEGAVTVDYGADGSVTVNFGPRTRPPSPYGIELIARSAGETNPFVGDFTAAGVEGVAFSITSDGHLPSAKLAFLEDEADARWTEPIDVSDTAGEVVENRLSLLADAPWTTYTPNGVWADSLQAVARIGIRLQPSGLEAQSYTVANFILFGEGGDTPPADLRPVISAMGKVARGLRIRWRNTAEGARYRVVRATNMFGPFEPVEGGEGIAGDDDLMEFTDENAVDSDRYFYKIIKE